MGHLGRLVWACLLCRDADMTGKVTRKVCSVHGRGEHVKKIRQ